MSIPQFEEIVEPNDQTEARRQHLDALRELVGNVYPNKFTRSAISGDEDTITNLLHFPPIIGIVAEINEIVATLGERERPPAEIKDALNARLREFGNVRIAGRLAVPPRVMGKAAFVHLSDGMNRLQIYVRRDDVRGVWNGSEPPAVAGGLTRHRASFGGEENQHTGAAGAEVINLQPPVGAGGYDASQSGWEIFQLLDHGDFIGVEGYLFITNTGELSVHVETLQFLAKAMLPMPDKMHGIADAEIKQRQRYVDLIGSSLKVGSQESGVESQEGSAHELSTREVFERRAKVISSMRHFLEDHGYIEVETPMLTPKATGAAARPFKTHHNALDIDLYARIAPELYLKRLVVGGFEKVYELNRNFRNEGISYKHNPEFTMLEFYCAYMDVEGMMDFCEELLRESVEKATGGLNVPTTKTKDPLRILEGRNKEVISFANVKRVSMKDAIYENWSESFQAVPEWWYGKPKDAFDMTRGRFERWWLDDSQNLLYLAALASALHTTTYFFIGEPLTTTVGINEYTGTDRVRIADEFTNIYVDKFNIDPGNITEVHKQKMILEIFETLTEPVLLQPTFIVDFPKSISPLSKASPENPQIAERFELFINGMEIANGFSELNDPWEQYERFIDQMGERDRGDEEAMIMDEDYIRALSYGMPPAAGIGIGIDRLVMLLTNRHSIRDVILFPHMRPERNEMDKAPHS